jgi:TonB family protein
MLMKCLAVFSLCFISGFTYSQSWEPSKVVGMEYPVIAIQSRIQGVIRVRCALDESGRVASVEIAEMSGSKGAREILGAPALENAAKWIFRNNDPNLEAPRFVSLSYNFRLEPRSNPRYLKSDFVFEYPQSIIITAEIPFPQPEGNSLERLGQRRESQRVFALGRFALRREMQRHDP